MSRPWRPSLTRRHGSAGKLGERIRLRHVPVLAIRRDDSIERGDRVLRLLAQLEEERGE